MKKHTCTHTAQAAQSKKRQSHHEGQLSKGSTVERHRVVPRSALSKVKSTNQIAKPAQAHADVAGSSCSVFNICGACTKLTQPYADQLAAKQDAITELMADCISQKTQVFDIIGMEEPFYYRNKVISPFAWAPKGRKVRLGASASQAHTSKKQSSAKRRGFEPGSIVCGMYAQNSHQIIDSSACLLENPVAKKVISQTKRLCERYGIEPYDEDTQTGFLRHVVVRIGHESDEVLVTLVTNKDEFVGARNFCKELVSAVPQIVSIVQNVNTRKTNVILESTRERTLYGPGFILDTLCGLSFRISSRSFYQVNAVQTERLYCRALELACLSGAEEVLDAYCGTGTIGLVAAHGLPNNPGGHAASLVGVDVVSSSIADAKMNARHNGINHAQFICADAGEFMRTCAQEKRSFDVVFMDPPRSGSDEAFLSALVSMAPKRLVYISCNPITQHRDLQYLIKQGYELEALQAVDMFPHTDHVECVCLMTRVG